MAKVLHGDAGGNQLNASVDKTQAYGLKGNDTLVSDGKSDVLLVGGSGNDSLIVMGGQATLSGGDGSDTFELNYSADKKLSAVIEDLQPSQDKIVVNFDGSTAPQLSAQSISGGNVVLQDGDGLFKVTLKSVRDNDYFDGEASEQAWDVLELTNQARENANASLEASASLSPLTMSQGLMTGAQTRAEEIHSLGKVGTLKDHTRPDGTKYFKVPVDGNLTLEEKYHDYGENLDGGAVSPESVMSDWMGSEDHKKNILDEEGKNFSKLGVGYVEDHSDSNEYYWVQLFASSVKLPEPETVTAANLLTANIETISTSKFIAGDDNANTLENNLYGATIDALGGNDSIANTGLNVSISAGADDDTILSGGSFATIAGNAGNDLISLSSDSKENVIEYSSGDGNDTISGLNSTDTLSISGSEFTPAIDGDNIIVGVGSDSITLIGAASSGVQIEGAQSKIILGTQNADSLSNTADAATIAAMGNDDTITNSGSNVSISAGAGDDSISNSGSNVLFFYESGNDTIGGFDETSTLKIAGGSLSSFTSNNDLILLGATDSIKILGAASLSPINIVDANDNPVEIGNAKDVRGTEQADNLSNAVDGATIQAFGGDDTIDNSGGRVSIYGGAGNDSVNNNEQRLTFYFYESGNDTIDGFTYQGVLNIGNYAGETVKSGTDILVNIISNSETVGTVTLKDYPADQEPNIVSYRPSTSGEEIDNTTSSTLITGTANSDTIENRGTNVTVNALNGDDSVTNGTVGSSSLGSNSIIYGDGGNDFIGNYGDNATLVGDAGNDSIINSGKNVSMNGGAGNDYLNTSYSDNSTLDGGDGDDQIINSYSGATILSGAGDDYILNTDGDNSSINSGTGNDTIINTGNSVTIDSGADNDYIYNSGANVSIIAGAGNDSIYLVEGSQNNFIQYNVGDGDDTIYGLDKNDKLQLGDGHVKYSTVASGNDVLVKVGDNTITLKDFKEKPENIIIGESGTSGGSGSGGGSGGGTSSSGSGGSSGQSGGNTSGGTSASANSNSDASGGQSASGSSGTSAASGGNGSSGRGNSSSSTTTTTAGSSIFEPITMPENLSTTSTTRRTTNYNPLNTSVTTTRGTYNGNIMSPIERIYTGGNKIIKHYGSWRKITFDEIYRGAHFDGAGNFIVESSTGHLVFENATDKVINLKDAAGNDFIKAHMSSSAGTVDGRIYSGYQILNGSLGEDLIFAGADGSQLWGNADTAADTLVGGDGADIFVGGKNEGSDTFQNASAADVINLNDTTLSDIVSTNTRDGALVISFNTGNTLTVQSTEALSANIVFSDGTNRRFNHATNSWQSE